MALHFNSHCWTASASHLAYFLDDLAPPTFLRDCRHLFGAFIRWVDSKMASSASLLEGLCLTGTPFEFVWFLIVFGLALIHVFDFTPPSFLMLSYL